MRVIPRCGAAALLLALAALPARAEQVNLNELTGATPTAPATTAAIPEKERLAVPADAGGLEAGGGWFVVNNAGTNVATAIGFGDGRRLRALQLLVYASDIDWYDGRALVQSATGSGRAAGEGYRYPDLPAGAIVVEQPANRIAFMIDATSPRTPNLLTMQTDAPIRILVNDRDDPGGYADNSGAFDLFLRYHRP